MSPFHHITLADIACSEEDFSTLCELLVLTELDVPLSDGEYTVFAPTNEAFEALGNETIAALLNDTEALTDILLYHVASGVYNSSDLECTAPLEMLNGLNTRTKCIGSAKFQSGIGNTADNEPEIIAVDIEVRAGIGRKYFQTPPPPLPLF
jgi:uncharacterized surface protein with fasciclin (FAS1) repeats